VSTMKSFSLGVFVALACMGAAGPSDAAPMLVGSTDDASGIDGLVVDSVTYDVTFVNGTYDSVYTTPPTFLTTAPFPYNGQAIDAEAR
jgi:hypothetical protein